MGLALAGLGMLAGPATSEPTTRGTLRVQAADGEARGAAVLLETNVEIRITGPIARTVVRQHFVNTTEHWLDGVYAFPLPEMAAVDGLRVRVGDRAFEGRIQERDEARHRYAKARAEGRKASLVEQDRPNLFQTAVANVGPGEPVEVEIHYQEVLRFDAGEFQLRFPLLAGARYAPGGAEATPASSRSERLHLHVDLAAGLPIRRVRCDSHALQVTRHDRAHHELVLETRDPERDFLLRFELRQESGPVLALFSERHAEQEYVLLMLLPPDPSAARARRLARETVFLVDTSGSMGGESIRQAREALRFALDQLRPDDRFNVIQFNSRTHALFDSARPADRVEIEAAHRYVAGLQASGGTEMLPALQAALESAAASVDVRQVVFLTDGSIANEAELFRSIEQELGETRLFTVGIGSAPNAYFLHRAASFGRGTYTFVSRTGEVRERMGELLEKLEQPVATELDVHWNDPVEMWPKRPPDLYAGEPLLIVARVERFVGDVVLTGRSGERAFEMRVPFEPGREERGVARLWARRKIAVLMDELGTGGDRERLRHEVTRVALDHGLVSRFTSLVAEDVTPTRPRHASRIQAAVGPGAAGVVPGGVLPRTGSLGPGLSLLGSSILAAGLLLRLHLGGRR
jgi:Ca-activated chloride channel family protein